MIYALGGRVPEFVGEDHFVAENASLIGHVRLLPKSSIWFNAVLRGDIELIEVGEGSNIQDGCVLHTDRGFPLTVGNHVTVGHMVMLHGCTIDDNALIGIGSTVLNGARIASDSIVGANSLVTENRTFPPGSLILGSPARVIRDLTDEEITSISESAGRYVDNARQYRETLRPSGL